MSPMDQFTSRVIASALTPLQKCIILALRVHGGTLTKRALCEALGRKYPDDRHPVQRHIKYLVDKKLVTAAEVDAPGEPGGPRRVFHLSEAWP